MKLQGKANVVAIVTVQDRPERANELVRLLKDQSRPLQAVFVLCESADVLDAIATDGLHVYKSLGRAGLNALRNDGIDFAAGADFVAFFDGDVLPSRDWIARALAQFSHGPSLAGVSGMNDCDADAPSLAATRRLQSSNMMIRGDMLAMAEFDESEDRLGADARFSGRLRGHGVIAHAAPQARRPLRKAA